MDQRPGVWTALEASLQALPRELGVVPRAILAVSAHWEADAFTVQTHPNPPMLYDYGGYPDFTYEIQYPAPGSPEVAARVVELLGAAGISTRVDGERGFDHGVFAPVHVAYPDADVPIVQLSITRRYDPAGHLAAGQALAPLRDEGVLIVGSGLSYHNLHDRTGAWRGPASREFEAWLTAALVDGPLEERTEKLVDWEKAPSARACHPEEDHLIPLMVAVGAAEHDSGVRTYHEDAFAGVLSVSSYRFGALPGEQA
jgi:aromatic ring-opening dioxygenase catalytic subunit (LigB family)